MKWLNLLRKKRRRYRRKRRKPAWRKVLLGVSFVLLAGFITFIGLVAWYSRDLPRPDKVVRREGFTSRIYDRNGEVLYDIFKQEKRTPIRLAEAPENLVNATIAIEDKSFYKHQGFSPRGIARAAYQTLVYRDLQGGSTLTQQLVKNVLLTSERTVNRKVKEFILALQIEIRFSKDEILEMYLNEAPYGGSARGVGAAAELYFDKKVADLTLVESAILAGLPQQPTSYSPFGPNPKAYLNRTRNVLRRMSEDGYITGEARQQAEEELEEITFASLDTEFLAPHFVMQVKEELVERYGEAMVEKGGLQVTTSLDLNLQEKVEKVVKEELKQASELNIGNAGVVVMSPETGEILAMIGSKDYNEPQFGKVNVTTALRQPGSAIKPVTYATALKRGFTASHLLMDVRTEFPGAQPGQPYVPTNYTGEYHGPLQMRYTLGSSKNIPAVKMLAQVGLKNMLDTGYDMGLETLEPTPENRRRLGLSVTLGGGEVRLLDLARAYCAFANEGFRVSSRTILRVENKDGKVLEEANLDKGRRVLSAAEAFLISDILSDNDARLLAFSPNSLLNIPGRPVAVKTGTTNDLRDNWAVGWTPQVLVGVWVGNNDNSPMNNVASGLSGATPIWRRTLLLAHEDKPVRQFEKPAGIVTEEVDEVSGFAAHDDFPARQEYFITGTEPTSPDPVHKYLKICRDEGKLATEIDIARDNYEEKEFFIFKEETPYSVPEGVESWQEGIDKWLATQEDPRYHPPTEKCDTEEEIIVRILSPENKSQVEKEFQLEFEPVSLKGIRQAEIYADGKKKQTLSGPPWQVRLVLSRGTHELLVKVTDQSDRQAEAKIKIGVEVPWDWQEPTPTPDETLTPTLSPTITPTPTPVE